MSYLSLKLGPKVPRGALNLAWVTVPQVTPEQNVALADLAATIPANEDSYTKRPLQSNVSSYTVVLGESGAEKTVTNSLIGHYSTPIQVLPPVEDPTGAWHLRVMDGVFQQRLKVSPNDGSWIGKAFGAGTEIVAIYTLPEKLMTPHNADYSDFTEYVAEDPAIITSSRSVQLSFRDLASIIKITLNGTSLAFPAAPNWSDDNMVIDPMQGTITFLNRTIAPTDDIRVSYGHRSPFITYHGYYDADGVFRDLDLNPAYGHTYDNGKDTRRLTERVITLFLIPTAAYDYEASLTGQLQIVRAHDILADTPEERTFLRWGADILGGLPEVPIPSEDGKVYVPRGAYGSAKYGREHFSATTPETDFGSDDYSDPDGANSDLAEYPSAVVLARVYVSSTGNADSVIVTDTRRRGGGLTDDPVKRRATLTGEQIVEARTCWDISGWDGDPVMLNGTTVIELPDSLLVRKRGRFTEAEVEEIVRKRLPVGVLPIIRYIPTPVTVTSEEAAVTEDAPIFVIQAAETNLVEVLEVVWDGSVLDESEWTPGVDLIPGTITLNGTYNWPAYVYITYKF